MTLAPPISKSDAHRALVLHALAHSPPPPLGESPPHDVLVLQRGLAALAQPSPRLIDCADAGAPFRILVALAALTPGETRFTGVPRLAQRPHAPLFDALNSTLGEHTVTLDAGWPRVRGTEAAPRELHFRCASADSSQFATALLLAGASHLAHGGTAASLTLDGPLASAGYLELTLRWLADAGLSITRTSDAFELSGTLHAPRGELPGDWSSLGYLLLIAYATGGNVSRVGDPSLHPDGEILGAFLQAGLRLERSPETATLRGALSGALDVSAHLMPDAMLTLAALACVLPSPSTFRELGILRHKESDRVESMRALVAAASGRTELHADTLRVLPPRTVQPLELDSRGDHRLAMSAATLAALAHVPLRLSGADCVEKSFPTFFRELARAGVTFEP